MGKIKKRGFALMLVFAMIASLFTGISASAEGIEISKEDGLCIAGCEWKEDTPVFETVEEWFQDTHFIEVKAKEILSIGIVKDKKLSPVSSIENLTFFEGDGTTPLDSAVYSISDKRSAWVDDGEGGHNEDVDLAAGLYNISFFDEGRYTVKYTDGDNTYSAEIIVGLPGVGLYTTETASVENMVCPNGDWFTYENGKTYYINGEEIATDANIISATIRFNDCLGLDDIDWKAVDFKTQAFKIPDYLTGDYDRLVEVVLVTSWTNDEGEVVTDDRWRYGFNARCSDEGLVIAGSNWGEDEDINERRDFPIAADRTDEFRKDWGCAVYDDAKITLGIKTDEGITLLDKNSLDKLSIVDDTGKAVDASAVKFGNYIYKYRVWDDENQQDVEAEKEITDLFCVRAYKCGTYYIKYKDGDTTFIIRLDVGMPELGIYGKKVASEKYILGSYETEYDKDRRTFYILPYDIEDEYFTNKVEITGKAKGYSSDVRVKTDAATGVVAVTISDDCTEDFTVKVPIKITEKWYEDRDGEKLERETHERTEFREFFFHPSEEVRAYAEGVSADIKAAEDVEEMVNALPDEDKIKTSDKDAIEAARKAYDGLTEEQKKIVDSSVEKKLAAAEEALKMAEKAAEEEAAAAEEAKKATEADKAAAVAEAKKAAEADKAAAVAEAKKAAEADKAEAVAEAKKAAEADREAAVAEAKKAAAAAAKTIPQAGDVIYDKSSKSMYVITTASDGSSAGAVEYMYAGSTVKKITIPSTVIYGGITYDVTSIGAGAFDGNTKLKTVVISEGVTSIGKNAYSGCKKLKTINIKSTKLTKVGKNAFKGIYKNATIKVPKAKLKDYKKLLKKKGQGKKVKIKK